jgi:hypothetical protein
MSARKTVMPAIPPVGSASSPEDLRRFADATKEALEVGLGRRGDTLDRFLTVRDLEDIGVVRTKGGTLVGTGAAIPPGGQPGAPIFQPGDPDFGDEDYTIPPKPTNVTARGIPPSSIMVTWDPPNYSNHAYTEVFVLQANPSFDAMLARSPAFDRGKPHNTSTNPHVSFAGTGSGSQFFHRDLVRLVDPTLDALDQALNPTAYFYWVRFVSTANVPGPFHTTGAGAMGRLSIDPVAVLDAMAANIRDSGIYPNLRQLIGGHTPEELAEIAAKGNLTRFFKSDVASVRSDVQGLAGVIGDTSFLAQNETLSSITRMQGDTLRSLWSVRMNVTQGGVTHAAGFGLGLDVNSEGQAISTFLVNANQFAIMGPTTPAVAIRSMSVVVSNPALADVTFVTPYTLPDGIGYTVVASTAPGSPIASLDNIACTVVSQNAFGARLRRTSGSWPGNVADGVGARWGLAILGESSIPFIVDTVRNVVGIRGSLIVDGLVRGTQGEFDALTADTAFFRHVTAEVMRAKLFVGDQIIAGASEGNTSNWRVELNSPTATGTDAANWPMRYWRPGGGAGGVLLPGMTAGQMAFGLDRMGNLFVGGHLSVGKNAVIATTGDTVASFGGAGADGDYALWVGPKGVDGQLGTYGGNGRGRTEGSALFWIKDNGRAGFGDIDLFLGPNALSLPTLAASKQEGATITGHYEQNRLGPGPRATSVVTSAVSTEALTIRALRSGAAARTLVIVTGVLYSFGTEGNGDDKRFLLRAKLVGSRETTEGVVIQQLEMDDYKPEGWDYTLMGVVDMPAGDYYVRLELINIQDRKMSICRGWNAVAMQLSANAGLVSG